MGYTVNSLPHVRELLGDKNKFVIAGFDECGMPRALLSDGALARGIKKTEKRVGNSGQLQNHRPENEANTILEVLKTSALSNL